LPIVAIVSCSLVALVSCLLPLVAFVWGLLSLLSGGRFRLSLSSRHLRSAPFRFGGVINRLTASLCPNYLTPRAVSAVMGSGLWDLPWVPTKYTHRRSEGPCQVGATDARGCGVGHVERKLICIGFEILLSFRDSGERGRLWSIFAREEWKGPFDRCSRSMYRTSLPSFLVVPRHKAYVDVDRDSVHIRYYTCQCAHQYSIISSFIVHRSSFIACGDFDIINE
jgi:hypothetical protein